MIADNLKHWLRLPGDIRPRKRVKIRTIDQQPAAKSDLAQQLVDCGFEKEQDQLVLWPSAVGKDGALSGRDGYFEFEICDWLPVIWNFCCYP